MAEDLKRTDDRGGMPPVPLVMLPGTLCDERVFAPLVARLPGIDIRVLPITGADSAQALARMVLASAPPRFLLAGFSLGGIVALQVAAIAPDRVSGLILIATNACADQPENAAPRRANVADARVRGIASVVLERFWPRYVSRASRDDARLRELILDMAEAVGIEAFARQVEVAISRADSLPRLASLHIPVLVLGGEEDALCPPDTQRAIAEAAPDATLHIIAGAGHFALLDAPQLLAAHVIAWLEQFPAHQNHAQELP